MGIDIRKVATSSRPTSLGARSLKALLLLAAFSAFGALIVGFVVWPLSPADLGKANHGARAQLYAHWQAGDLVVLVRHGERCDRSNNRCLSAADGITLVGRDAARQLGAALLSMGMANTDVRNSPLTRTTQTAQSMFGQLSQEEDWLVGCDAAMSTDIRAHKAAGRNLVLVTHSGCIEKFQSEMGFPYAKESEYASSMFAILGPDGEFQVLGVLNVQDWPRVIRKNPAL